MNFDREITRYDIAITPQDIVNILQALDSEDAASIILEFLQFDDKAFNLVSQFVKEAQGD